MKKFYLLPIFIILILSSYVNAEISYSNWVQDGSLSHNGRCGFIFEPSQNITLTNAIRDTQGALETTDNRILLYSGGVSLINATGVGENISIEYNLTAGQNYTITTGYWTGSTWGNRLWYRDVDGSSMPTSDNNITWLCGSEQSKSWCNVAFTGCIDAIEFTVRTPIIIINNFSITSKNVWNNSNINTFSALINETIYNTTNGTILTNILKNSTNLYNITIFSTNYYNKTYTNYNVSNNLEATLYQSIAKIKTQEIFTSYNLTNFSIQTENGWSNTTNGTITLYPNKEMYYWNFTSPEGYFNQTNLEFNQTPYVYKNWTILNMYTAVWRHENNLTNASITPFCTYDIYNVTTSKKAGTKGSTATQILCSLFGYNPLNSTITGNAFNNTFKMQPVQLMITFSEKTSGYVSWEGQVNGSEGFSFNATSILQNQDKIGIGEVTIVYNEGQQIYQYYNDLNTHINQYLHVTTPTFIQPVKLWDGTALLEGQVIAYKFINGSYVNVYQTFTDSEGLAQMVIEDGENFKLTGSANGYDTASQLEYIPPSSETTSTNIIFLELTKTTSETEKLTYQTSCPNIINTPTTCTVTANSNVNSYEFMFKIIGNNTVTDTYSESASATTSIIVNRTTVNQTTNNILVEIYLDGTYKNTITLSYKGITSETKVIGPQEDDDDFVQENILWFILAVLFSSIIVGIFMENKFEGWGFPSSIAWISALGFLAPVLWSVSLLYTLWIIYDRW